MKIDLIGIARRNGFRRNWAVLRPINPTQTQAVELYRVFLPAVTAWETQVRDRLLPEYSRTLAQTANDSIIDMEAIIRFIEEYAAALIQTEIRSGILRWANDLAGWHFRRFVANVKYVTNVDLNTLIGPEGEQVTINDFLARNTALIRDVSDQTRGRVADIVFRNAQLRTPVRDVAREISEATGLARKRAMRIASDQANKLSASLDRERQLQVGIDKFRWKHSGKVHYRPEHLARNGDVFSWTSEVARTDPPGYAPFCGCKAEGVLE